MGKEIWQVTNSGCQTAHGGMRMGDDQSMNRLWFSSKTKLELRMAGIMLT